MGPLPPPPWAWGTLLRQEDPSPGPAQWASRASPRVCNPGRGTYRVAVGTGGLLRVDPVGGEQGRAQTAGRGRKSTLWSGAAWPCASLVPNVLCPHNPPKVWKGVSRAGHRATQEMAQQLTRS